LNNLGGAACLVSPEEDGRAEDPFEGGGQSAILLAAFHQTECVRHLGRTPEADNLALLLHRHCCHEEGNEAVLAVRQSKARMSGQLKDEVSIPALVDQLIGGRAPDGQPAEYERARRKGHALSSDSRFCRTSEIPSACLSLYLEIKNSRRARVRMDPARCSPACRNWSRAVRENECALQLEQSRWLLRPFAKIGDKVYQTYWKMITPMDSMHRK
jgi:hypothetical protein